MVITGWKDGQYQLAISQVADCELPITNPNSNLVCCTFVAKVDRNSPS